MLAASRGKVAEDTEAVAVVLLAEVPYNFAELRDSLKKTRLIVTSDKPDVQQAAKEDEVAIVPLQDEPQTRQYQVSQALLEAISGRVAAQRRRGCRGLCGLRQGNARYADLHSAWANI